MIDPTDLYCPDARAEFIMGFHSVIAPSHNRMAYQTHEWTLADSESLWEEQVDYMEGSGPGEGHCPGWGAREESGGWANGVIHGRDFLDAYDEPYYETAR
jgi:hypothetical protein